MGMIKQEDLRSVINAAKLLDDLVHGALHLRLVGYIGANGNAL